MAQTNDDKEAILEAIPTIGKAAKLSRGHTEDQYRAISKELSACKGVAESDRLLLDNGLRLALKNEALQLENTELRKGVNNAEIARKAGRSLPE
jgi:hypothetical protein